MMMMSVLGHELRDVIGRVAIGFPIGHFLLVVLWNQAYTLTVSGIFNGECDAMVDMTLNYF